MFGIIVYVQSRKCVFYYYLYEILSVESEYEVHFCHLALENSDNLGKPGLVIIPHDDKHLKPVFFFFGWGRAE